MKQVFVIIAVVSIILMVLVQHGLFKNSVNLDAIVPSVAGPGEEIILQGKGLEKAPDRTVVFFNDLSAEPKQVMKGAIRVLVPAEARSGLVSVVVGEEATEARFFEVRGGRSAMPPGHAGMMKAAENPKQQLPPGESEAAGPRTGGAMASAHEFYTPDKARDLIDFELNDESGKKVRLSDYKGKVIALNFWATWCKPCLEEIPSLERLTKRSGAMRLVIIAVSVDKSFGEIKKALPDIGLNVLLDPKSEIANKYGTFKFPETWVIDKKGRIVARFIGARNWDSPMFENFFSILQKGGALPGTGGK